ncbi:Alpha/beta hydrolase fold-3 [Cordyceps fumosorosea ARSEF 2679]|uniref:Alpha/beta hydrolase fold-3 n=1 Tax=Cordyceps fumosorosea (strain ARSEF 2679) TaxID=1081104 RepID=A0A168AP95_CORFA|nr:Alpha/beta hydrolase fold-3 [Cordyceps fumosorosea ARSEF 2679]OAA69008.1 Alpha/beta hydrolase fold-3 [Cordyceps fumosorosea ARSEF 2679]
MPFLPTTTVAGDAPDPNAVLIESKPNNKGGKATQAVHDQIPTIIEPTTVQLSSANNSYEHLEKIPDVVEADRVDYINPFANSSRWYVSMRAHAIRSAAGMAFSLSNRTVPAPPVPSQCLWLDSTLSAAFPGKDKIKVDVWMPPPRIALGPRAAVINFHGGGWILGAGTDDSRWAAAVMTSMDAVVFSVNYRLAPAHPFPTPIEDCVDAILQIAARADEFGFDPNRIVLSGFSAGASNALSSWVVLQEPQRWDYELPQPVPAIAGLALFYPVLDWTFTRPEKRSTCHRPDLTLSPGLTDLIDASYVYPEIPRKQCDDWRLSPGLVDDATLAKLPPVHLCLCEYDMLLQEGLRFAKRVRACPDKTLTLRVVSQEKHAWDKPLPLAAVKESVAAEYTEATLAMASWLGQFHDTDNDSMLSLPTKRLRLRPSAYFKRSRSAE